MLVNLSSLLTFITTIILLSLSGARSASISTTKVINSLIPNVNSTLGDVNISASIKNSKKKSASSGSFSGKGTFYMTGLGSCGEISKDTDLMVALNKPQMEEGWGTKNSNKNPLCGRYIMAHGPKGSVKVKVLDTCPPCAEGSLDFSAAAYAKLGDYDDGVIKITWDWA
ncbi:hypothetical protein [Parasitella parasitica]|uniref:RlpA-like protein double-psi beta-barrel domain-containing protein n=1 Tax=Parasitella parasitica TaxID=35722 RepID=A0A0B7NCE6_9FUNG|nr:hypothetical protein [Parasitella parasitica]